MNDPKKTNKHGYLENEDSRNGHSNLKHRNIAFEEIYRKNRSAYPKRFREYQVHHINHDKRDNRIDNLALLTQEEHELAHTFPACNDYEEFKEAMIKSKKRVNNHKSSDSIKTKTIKSYNKTIAEDKSKKSSLSRYDPNKYSRKIKNNSKISNPKRTKKNKTPLKNENFNPFEEESGEILLWYAKMISIIVLISIIIFLVINNSL
jgi:hypothetical protein